MSAHVQRKHVGLENPFPQLKLPNPFQAYSNQKQVAPPIIPPNSEIPKIPPVEIVFPDLQAVLDRVRRMNRYEINMLMLEVIGRLRSLNHWSSRS
jgi:hypothetical protein